MASAAEMASTAAGRPLLVLAAPKKSDSYYKDSYHDIVKFVASYARRIIQHGRDNVLILADSGTADDLKSSPYDVPKDVVIETDCIGDVWMRDCTLVNMTDPVMFKFKPQYMKPAESKHIQRKFMDFLKQAGISQDSYRRSDIILDGGNVVDNHNGIAIVTERVAKDNKFSTKKPFPSEKRKELTEALGVKEIAVIPEYPGDKTGHSDGLLAFIDTLTLAVPDLDPINVKVREALQEQIPDVNIVQISSEPHEGKHDGFSTTFGIHANLVMTDSTLYIPTFGEDPNAHEYEQSLELDRQVLDEIRQHTSKQIVSIPMPHAVSRFGGSVRCLTWQIKGPIADKLIEFGARN